MFVPLSHAPGEAQADSVKLWLLWPEWSVRRIILPSTCRIPMIAL
jgi:hypothetical protein